MSRKSRLFAYSISSPDTQSANVEVEIAESLQLVRRYARFAETIGEDWYDHHCRLEGHPLRAGNASPSCAKAHSLSPRHDLLQKLASLDAKVVNYPETTA
jgi:hypothetical protein